MSSQSSTPARRSGPSRNKNTTTSPTFTAAQQDAQARNKDPYVSSSSDSEYEFDRGSNFDAYGSDTYENIQRKREAALVLDNPELLMMHSVARNDSIAGTRLYFTKKLCGYLGDEAYLPQVHDKDDEKGKSKPSKRPKPIS